MNSLVQFLVMTRVKLNIGVTELFSDNRESFCRASRLADKRIFNSDLNIVYSAIRYGVGNCMLFANTNVYCRTIYG